MAPTTKHDQDIASYDEINEARRVTLAKVSDAASEFNTNDIEEASATVTYIGTENKGGTWYVKKIDTSSGTVFGHATVTNNPTRTSYALAWTNRATLTYEDYGVAF